MLSTNTPNTESLPSVLYKRVRAEKHFVLATMIIHSCGALIQYKTIQLIFDIALLLRTCTFMPRRRRCNCNAEHCGRGTCSRSLRDLSNIERDSNSRPFGRKVTNLLISHQPTTVHDIVPLPNGYLLRNAPDSTP